MNPTAFEAPLSSRSPLAATALVLGLLMPLTASPAHAQGAKPQATTPAAARDLYLHTPYTPSIVVDLPEQPVGYVAGELTFQVRVVDPQGDLVSLKLLNPPPGLIFHPLVDAASGTTSTIRWRVPSEAGGLHTLVFEAHDAAHPDWKVRRKVPLRVEGQVMHKGLAVGDVTGDGVLDVVATARVADLGTVTNAGAVYVWAGSTTPSGAPTAKLAIADPTAGDLLGDLNHYGQGLQLADVNGDRILDVIAGARFADLDGAMDAGAVFVWAGGSTLAGSSYLDPTAVLKTPAGTAHTALGDLDDSGQGITIADLTGDGCLDLLVAAPADPDHAGGAIYLWAGGSGLKGTPAPTATLVHGLTWGMGVVGLVACGQGIQLAEVTGDGVLDVVAGAVTFHWYGGPQEGGVFVWKGGPGLSGQVPAEAILTDDDPQPWDSMCLMHAPPPNWPNGFKGFLFEDVTGDDQLDVIAGAVFADRDGLANAGAVFVWAGGSSLSGWVIPTAELDSPQTDMALGFIDAGQGIQTADVSGDDVADIVAAACKADQHALADDGALFVWLGGSDLTGEPPPDAILAVPGAASGDSLARVESGQGFQFEDVSGDGILDVVAAASAAEIGGVVGAGAVYVWEGGPSLTGSAAPLARLAVSGSTTANAIGSAPLGQGVQLGDLTGDGIPDVLAIAPIADIGGVVDCGALYLWEGGPALTGSLDPTATLSVPGASAGDLLGHVGFYPGAFWEEFVPGVQLADVSGDGVLDVIAGASWADVGGLTDTGAVYVWRGGGGLTGAAAPAAELVVPSATSGDMLGESLGADPFWITFELSQMAIQVADVNGDGLLDVVAAAPFSDVAGVSDTGAVHVWRGGSTLVGTLPPSASLTVPGAHTGDQLGTPLVLAEVSGDGVLDVIAAAVTADVGGVADTGALYLWSGSALGGASAPTATWTVPGAANGDWLGH